MCFTLLYNVITFMPCFWGEFFLIPIINCNNLYDVCGYISLWCTWIKHIANVLDGFGRHAVSRAACKDAVNSYSTCNIVIQHLLILAAVGAMAAKQEASCSCNTL